MVERPFANPLQLGHKRADGTNKLVWFGRALFPVGLVYDREEGCSLSAAPPAIRVTLLSINRYDDTVQWQYSIVGEQTVCWVFCQRSSSFCFPGGVCLADTVSR